MFSVRISSILVPLLLLTLFNDVQASAGCCSLNYKDCDAPWCGDTEEECNNCENDTVRFLDNGQLFAGCLARWKTCTDNKNDCCDGLLCKDINNFYSQCLPDDGAPTTGVPTDNPTSPGTTGAPTDNPTSPGTTGAPTDNPTSPGTTNNPTATPDDPTAPPTDDDREACEDNTGTFFYKGFDVSCSDIASLGNQKRARKCRDARRLVRECPSVCLAECAIDDSPTISPTNPRGPCEDNSEPFEFKGKVISCADIEALGPQRQSRKCNEGRRIEDECPSVCDEGCTIA